MRSTTEQAVVATVEPNAYRFSLLRLSSFLINRFFESRSKLSELIIHHGSRDLTKPHPAHLKIKVGHPSDRAPISLRDDHHMQYLRHLYKDRAKII